jgi:hypothetical protein
LTTTSWREKLLQTPIGDYRKNAVSLILAPYIINIKKLSSDDAFNIIKEWLDKCNEIRRLDCIVKANKQDMVKLLQYNLEGLIQYIDMTGIANL